MRFVSASTNTIITCIHLRGWCNLRDHLRIVQVKSAKRKRIENDTPILDLDTFLKDVAALGEGLVKNIYLSPAGRKGM